MAAIDKVFPQEFLSIAKLLGIDIRKPVELCHYGRESSGLQLTGGWFHLVGQIVSGPDATKQVAENGVVYGVFDLEKLTDNFEFGFTSNVALVRTSFAGKHLVQLEFMTRIP